jgi:hypothetical protein
MKKLAYVLSLAVVVLITSCGGEKNEQSINWKMEINKH